MDYDLFLSIINTGGGTASRVRVLIDDKPITTYSEFLTEVPENLSIGPNGRLDILYVLFSKGTLNSMFHVKLFWDDASGQNGEWADGMTRAAD